MRARSWLVAANRKTHLIKDEIYGDKEKVREEESLARKIHIFPYG